MKAVLFGLQSLCRNMHRMHIRIMSDNTTAIACINKQGSTKSRHCNDMAKIIWDFALQNQLWLSAAHCPGVQNVQTDEQSRKFNDQTEWTLQQVIFDIICVYLGTPYIDLFATRLNFRMKPYGAWHPDPEAIHIDSMMYEWGGGQILYAFPPFRIIHLVLQKWLQEESEGILVVPVLPIQAWFPVFANMIVKNPLSIQVNRLFFSVRRQ